MPLPVLEHHISPWPTWDAMMIGHGFEDTVMTQVLIAITDSKIPSSIAHLELTWNAMSACLMRVWDDALSSILNIWEIFLLLLLGTHRFNCTWERTRCVNEWEKRPWGYLSEKCLQFVLRTFSSSDREKLPVDLNSSIWNNLTRDAWSNCDEMDPLMTHYQGPL